MVEIDVVKAMWSGHPDRLKLARREAWLLKTAGKPLEAHSTMLSAYLSVRGGGQYGKVATAWHDALMTWHAYRLTRNKTWKSLNHNQLDVLISFWINILEWTREAVWFIDVLLNDLASRELQLVHDRDNQAKPHQIALAHIRKAEVCLKLRHPWFKNDAIQHVYIAEGKEAAIRNEEGQPQGLLQLVRILRKAGEIYGKVGSSDYKILSLSRALEIAESLGDQALDQKLKIQILLDEALAKSKEDRQPNNAA